MSTIKLFCFPYAGGSATIYSKWASFLSMNKGIELIPVELSGRGKRIEEPLYKNLQDAVEDLLMKIEPEITDTPYAFFGHSLGGLLAYELALKIKHLGVRQPLHIFFSGRAAPDVKSETKKKYHLMDEEEFKNEVIALGGTSKEFFNHPELLALFMPMLRNDFKLAETDFHERETDPFDYDITILSGKDDHKVSAVQIDAWKGHTNTHCDIHYFEGGHFFLHDQVAGITKLILDTMKRTSLKDINLYSRQ
ncbi:thioesterase II family protein [Mucilaginibacter sp. SJ]|uniref:thioesterase II family protein n=1 Tax=Mucilaginibacter sp. SJ TaxID=3029053 RepID=UPI0023A9458D|nr:thioesterase domain-containing protein [Mucilaginibacter sp. SJ]WEA01648.1 thioesterase domain-containing protein [Mucilaginibacter sp. SJ]